jgi:hypothetical protein
MPLAVSRSLMGAMISTRAKNLADGPSFADRFSRQKRNSLARTFPHLSDRLTRMLWGTRCVLLLSGGETKKPRQARTASGANWGKTPKPSRIVSAVRAALPTNGVYHSFFVVCQVALGDGSSNLVFNQKLFPWSQLNLIAVHVNH